MKKTRMVFIKFIAAIFVLILCNYTFAQIRTDAIQKYPVILKSDTLFYINEGIGVFSADQRAKAINVRLDSLVKNDNINYDSILVAKEGDFYLLKFAMVPIMAIDTIDAKIAGTTRTALAKMYRSVIVDKLKHFREAYSQKAILNYLLYSILYAAFLIIFLGSATKVFPWIYKKIEILTSTKIDDISIKDREIVKTSMVGKIVLFIIKGIRFTLTLLALYLFTTKMLQLWPYTRKWDLQPVIESIALFILFTVLIIVITKGINYFIKVLIDSYKSWKGTKIKSIKLRSIEILSAERTIGILTLITRVARFAFIIIALYSYLTIVFSLFTFSRTWSKTLLDYVLNPVEAVLNSLLNYLPNLFFIIVIIFVFNYLIKAIKFIFKEIEKDTLAFPGFHKDWAIPTFKIVRFSVLVLGTIIVFPYLPGSQSPVFHGISIFVGVLFSLGSSTAISNIVAGIVLTYMRPFVIEDRVKIADTIGDVVDKTLLVTRIRTIKNEDITIPNSMVLGSHIINFSSSANDKGLILHTTVTIGFDAPWRQVHELLIAAAKETEYILEEPKPFVLQISLDDFYVSYQINAYTDKPHEMAKTYSLLHAKIQDKFNEAGVEIMSSHFSSIRDGNQTTVPLDHLPKEYKAPSFRIFGIDLFGNANKGKE